MDRDGARPTNNDCSDDDPAPNEASATAAAAREQKAKVRFNSRAGPQPSQEASTQIPVQDRVISPRPYPRPPILRANSRDAAVNLEQAQDDPEVSPKGAAAAAAAQERANAMADVVWGRHAAASRRSIASALASVSGNSDDERPENLEDIALQPLNRTGRHAQHHSTEHSDTASTSDGMDQIGTDEDSLVYDTDASNPATSKSNLVENKTKPELEQIFDGTVDGSYNVPPPETYRGGVLSQLLKLYKQPSLQSAKDLLPSSPRSRTPDHKRTSSLPDTGSTTPERRKWYEQNDSQDTLSTLIQASTKLAKPALPDNDGTQTPRSKKKPRTHKQQNSISNRLSQILHQEEAHVKVHITGILARQGFIVKLCRALMLYGAPTHRLEEYLTMTARALEIEANFLYIPGCMLISFDDAATHTTEVKLVRLNQGIDLGRLKDCHRIYKEVIHDVIGVEEATSQLEEYMDKKPKFHPWFRVLIFGLTSVMAAPFSFHARLIDLPLCFFFGVIVGALQLIVAPKLPLYSNVFEVSATVLVSFLARAFGSLHGGDIFCFSALAQGGIVMLLPGYMFLSSSLELQARAIIPGSIRIVYGVIYSLLLGFGITIGAALYGRADIHATSALTCSNPMPSQWGFIFVPPFVLCISILYQAKWKQMPVMIIVAFTGYIVNYYSSLTFPTSPQIASTLGAFAVGAMANLYSRFRHGVAAAILIPAIFTQVPGSLASQGGLLSGLQVANEINNVTGSAVPGSTSSAMTNSPTDSVVFNVAGSMIQIAIGITVGLFLSALLVYPFGKRRSGLFSF